MKRAIGYARVSTTSQEKDGTSLETQDMEIRQRATERGYQLIGIMREDHTGTELDERPQLTKLRQMVRNGEVDTVVVWTFDRLARNMAHQGVILYETEKAGVSVESVKENFDDTLEGRLLRQVVAYMAEKEHQRIKERTFAGKQRRVEQGRPLFVEHPLYGYSFNETRTALIINPETVPIVVQIFTWAAEAVPLRQICIRLGKQGIKIPRGLNHWSVSTLRSIICNPAYYGKPAAFRYRTKKVISAHGSTYRVIAPVEEQIIPIPDGVIPPLVSEEVALKAQSRFTHRPWRPRIHPRRVLGGGIIVCGVCGRSCIEQYIRKYIYYTCDRRHSDPGRESCHVSTSAVPLEKRVWKYVCERLGDKAHFMEPLTTQYVEAEARKKDARDIVRQMEDKLAEAIDSLIKLAGTDAESEAAVRWRIDTLRDELKKHRERQQACEDRVERAAEELERAKTALAQAVAGAALGTGDAEARQHLLKLLGVRVTLYPKGHDAEITMAPWMGFGVI